MPSFQVKTADNRVIQEQLSQKVCIRTVSAHFQKANLNQTNSFNILLPFLSDL